MIDQGDFLFGAHPTNAAFQHAAVEHEFQGFKITEHRPGECPLLLIVFMKIEIVLAHGSIPGFRISNGRR